MKLAHITILRTADKCLSDILSVKNKLTKPLKTTEEYLVHGCATQFMEAKTDLFLVSS